MASISQVMKCVRYFLIKIKFIYLPFLIDPHPLPPLRRCQVEGPVSHHHRHIPPHWPEEAPDRVEGPGQPGAEPVALLEHDHEQVHSLQVGQEPGQLLQVVPAGVEARRVYDRDPGAVPES